MYVVVLLMCIFSVATVAARISRWRMLKYLEEKVLVTLRQRAIINVRWFLFQRIVRHSGGHRLKPPKLHIERNWYLVTNAILVHIQSLRHFIDMSSSLSDLGAAASWLLRLAVIQIFLALDSLSGTLLLLPVFDCLFRSLTYPLHIRIL